MTETIARGLSEESRSRGFPSPSFGGFGFVVCCAFFIRLVAGNNLIVNILGLFRATGNVGFGSAAAPQHDTRPTAAVGGKTDIGLGFPSLVRLENYRAKHINWCM